MCHTCNASNAGNAHRLYAVPSIDSSILERCLRNLAMCFSAPNGVRTGFPETHATRYYALIFLNLITQPSQAKTKCSVVQIAPILGHFIDF